MKNYVNKIFLDNEFYRLSIVFTVLCCLLLALDYHDVIAKYIVKNDITMAVIIAVGIIIICVMYFIKNHFIDLFVKIPIANILDRIIILNCVTAIVYYIAIHIFNQAFVYKCWILIVFFCLSLSVFIFRIIRYLYLMRKTDLNDNMVFELKTIVDANSAKHIEYPILISERDVDYDLFDRKEFIFQLEFAIETCCKSDMPFAIGLAGEWGTGKTTILNNVKKDLASNNKIDVIDNFDPWVYSSTKSMLSGMYYSILQKTGVHYNDLQVKELVKTAIEIIEESAKVKGIDKIAKSILSQSEGNDSISILKKQIDDYLRVKNKTIVFIIDNLDRASAENVRLVFKLVGAVLDFERVKYILSYDKNRLKDIFKESLKIDSRYVEKIINQEINVPKISKETKDDIYRRCIINYLSSSGVTIERIPDYENIIQFIVDEVKNIRMFKRLINSAFFMTFGNHSLYKPDLLMLEIIRFLDLELYDSIYKNKKYFIDSDTELTAETLQASFRIDEFNKDCKLYFDNLFIQKKKFIPLMSNAFPYVKNYASNYSIKQNYKDTERYKDTQLNSRINSAKFFDLYFSYSVNEYINTSTKFEKELLELLKSPDEISESDFSNIVLHVPKEEQQEWTQKLYLIKDDIQCSHYYTILISLYKHIYHFDNEGGFLIVSARERVYSVMAYLFSKIENQDEFITFMNNDINKLIVVSEMVYWLGDNNESSKNKLNKYAIGICDYMMKNNVDIYQDTIYEPGIIWAVFHTLKRCDVENREVELKQYLARIISPQNVYRALRDTVGSSIGRKYGYRIIKGNYESLFSEDIDVQAMLEKHKPKNSSEQLIFELYQDYRNFGDSLEHQHYFDLPYNFEL